MKQMLTIRFQPCRLRSPEGQLLPCGSTECPPNTSCAIGPIAITTMGDPYTPGTQGELTAKIYEITSERRRLVELRGELELGPFTASQTGGHLGNELGAEARARTVTLRESGSCLLKLVRNSADI